MLRNKIIGALLLALLLAMVSCGGGSGTPDPNNNFDRLTAQVLSANGQPLSGLQIRVEGTDTGLVTNASGGFTLGADDFPNGVDASNELSFGKGGFVVGTREIVPTDSPDLTITFDDGNSGEGSGGVGGTVTNANTGADLDGVQVTLFSVDGGVYQTNSSGGSYTFSDVPTGAWQLAAFIDGYTPVMAVVNVQDGQTVTVDLAMKQEGVVAPGDGLKVKGILKDSVTGSPIAGASLSLTADTGYWGVDDVLGKPVNAPGADTPSAGVGTGVIEPEKNSSMAMPIWYDPQYQETTTAADGSFEFENEVVGYSIYMNLSADGYLLGNYWQEIYGQTGTLELSLELTPIVPTDISGTVRDEDGNPVEGALVEFIFSGGFGGGPKPMPMEDVAVPPMANFEDWAADGTETRENVGAPVPAPDFGDASNAGGGDSAPAAGSDGGNPMDNLLMQKFRHDHQNGAHGTSDVNDGFDGYLSAVTGPDGKYSFTEVPAGPYWVVASAYKHNSFETEYEASAEETNTLDIEIDNIPVGTITGDVVDDETGEPVDDALVNAVLPNIDPFAYTDTSGHFTLENVPVFDGWIVGAYKAGYLTASQTVNVTADNTVTVHLRLTKYEAPAQDMVDIFGTIYDSSAAGNWDENGNFTGGSGVSAADIVFTPLKDELGSFYRHVNSDETGAYTTDLINGEDYNLLIQAEGYQDLFTRVWPNTEWRQMDFWMAPVNGGGGGVIVGGRPGTGGGSSGGNSGSTDPGVPPPPGDAIGL